MLLEKNRSDLHAPAWFCHEMLRRVVTERALDDGLITRIEKLAEGYKIGSGKFADEAERRERSFIRAMTKIIEYSEGDELVNRVLDGIGRTDERSLYNTALAMREVIEAYPVDKKKGMDKLYEVQAVMDRYHGGSAHNIGIFLTTSINKGNEEGFDSLCRTFGSEEIIGISNYFEDSDRMEGAKISGSGSLFYNTTDLVVSQSVASGELAMDSATLLGKKNMDGYFFANVIGYVAVDGHADMELALDAARLLKKKHVMLLSENPAGNVARLEWAAICDAISNASIVSDSVGVRKILNLADSLSAEDFLALSRVIGVYDGGRGSNKLKKFLDNGLDVLFESGVRKEAIFMTDIFLESTLKLPAPNLGETGMDGQASLRRYLGQVYEHVRRNYRINPELDELVLFAMTHAVPKRQLAALVRSNPDSNVKYYSMDVSGGVFGISFTEEEMKGHVVTALIGSRDREREAVAVDALRRVVGEAVTNKARTKMRTTYRNERKRIAGIFNDQKHSEIEKIEIAFSMLGKIPDASVLDARMAIGYKQAVVNDAKYVRAAESKNPLSYNSAIQHACTYLPDPIENSIFEYCKDERFVLVKYGIGDKTNGSAICYMEGSTFLVDSVEGNAVMRRDNIFEIVYDDLIARASEKGSERIAFGTYPDGNVTAQKFVEYIKGKDLKIGPVRLKLDTKGYLEAGYSDHVYVLDLKESARS